MKFTTNWETWKYEDFQSNGNSSLIVDPNTNEITGVKQEKVVSDFRTKLDPSESTFSNSVLTLTGPDSVDQEKRINFPKLGKTDFKLNYKNYILGFNKSNDGATIIFHGDKFSEKPIIKKSDYIAEQITTYNDFVHFSIEDIETGNIIPFRSYIDDFSDSYNSNWDTIKYPGRGDESYIYQTTNRKTSITWRVVALSQIDLLRNYEKLNYLASLMYPTYKNNFMRPNILRLGLGNWFRNTPVIMNSLNYKINEDTPWDIDITQENIGALSAEELPMYITVTAEFTVLHDSLPQKTTVAKFIKADKAITPEQVRTYADGTNPTPKKKFVDIFEPTSSEIPEETEELGPLFPTTPPIIEDISIGQGQEFIPTDNKTTNDIFAPISSPPPYIPQ